MGANPSFMKAVHTSAPRNIQSGFSLIELAIVLMIIGGLMSGVLVAVSQATANARITNAKAQLREVEEALYGYAQANGRLPCPATATSEGQADPVIGGVCVEWHGFVPVATLDLPGSINSDGLLLDPWQNPIRYSVSSYDHDTGSPSFTSVPSSAVGIEQLFSDVDVGDDGVPDFNNDSAILRVCDTPTCLGTVYADAAPAVLYSMGANWASYTSTNEVKNAGSDTIAGNNSYVIKDQADVTANDFVNATYSEDNFDDQVIWLSPYVLFNRLVSAGKLP
jgi:prepilin-type N-terminal cleavage/methylation domain-containing protein